MSSPTEYQVFKAILDAIELNLVGERLRTFVQDSTGCSYNMFEQVYSQIQQSWKI